jgi:hypothetical protein
VEHKIRSEKDQQHSPASVTPSSGEEDGAASSSPSSFTENVVASTNGAKQQGTDDEFAAAEGSLLVSPVSADTSFQEKEVAKGTSTTETTENVLGGIFWRGVVAILCALWASNFAAIKLVTAEPGEEWKK